MNNYPWLQVDIDKWQDIILSKKAPNAILLSGMKGLGKIKLAKSIAHLAVCEELSDKGICNNCRGCHLFNAGNHTDVTLIAAEKSVIKVEQIRKLSKDVTLSSTRNQYRVVIIENAEQMNKASANALLKTLEEPPAKVIIILTTSEIGLLLPTIKSRCFKINISAPQNKNTIEWLEKASICSKKEAEFSLVLANNAPLTAQKILENNIIDSIKLMLDDLNQLAKQQKTILTISKEWNSNNLFEHLPYISAYFLALLKNNNLVLYAPLDIFTNYDYTSIIDLNNKLINFIRNIFRFVNRNTTALKTELLIEELLINWRNDFKI